ncbi:hypothetical protein LA5095_03916 [Roseibium album]|uniref:Uncharacterized protein n=2 Tax=Roseibium album TaxID=311410 RepID=A0A0M6ZD84_9HYPH|nr:hypothetical protein LA5094_02857 [Roseibium album]CTQ77315.1 hypothetical protein LA5095_03916 [Roseibium album]CTQ77558.1 hypothetical protein LA5096_05198 [Roseibium album]
MGIAKTKGVNEMEWINNSYHEIGRMMREYGSRQPQAVPCHASAQARKWADQKGYNPLMMMGLDRS